MGPKGSEFKNNPNISAAFFWQQTNTQIRVKAQIYKSSSEFSDDHFKKRDKEKNILAISSNQSKKIDTYQDFLDVFEQASKEISDTTKRPDDWGGYSFRPYYFEFWQGHSKRINKREGYILKGDNWENFFLQP
jgi:pyridoxamine 5'-phosphate oxidase